MLLEMGLLMRLWVFMVPCGVCLISILSGKDVGRGDIPWQEPINKERE